MPKMTAVAKLYRKEPQSGTEQTALHFTADYDDERNKAWSKYTPALSLTMYVLPSVAENFDIGANYLLTFEKQN